jgi:hypothetical protein
MTIERLKTVSILIIVLLTVIFALNGCGGGFFSGSMFKTKPSNEGPVPSATNQLWQAARSSNWMVTIAVLGIAAGVFALLNGSKIGIPCIGASGVALFMALAVARFALWMAVFGLIGSVAAVAISVLVKNKALKDIIFGIQKVKETARHDNVDLVFQDKITKCLSGHALTTKKLVKKTKQKADLKLCNRMHKKAKM